MLNGFKEWIIGIGIIIIIIMIIKYINRKKDILEKEEGVIE